jgi:Na+/H+ antiporter NhaC
MEEKTQKKHGGLTFVPFVLFVVIYLGAGIYYQVQGVDFAFYQFPGVAAMFIALIFAFLCGKEKFGDKLHVFLSGIANEGVMTMLLVYMMAGAFSGVATAMGGRDATVNLGLSLIPVQFLAAGVFIISAFMGTATGTSIGTISAVVPIAIGIADKGGLNVALVVGACVGGAMFGDNLSMISDTTIAATSTQGVGMKDKFRVNLMIAIPAAVVTIVLLLIFGRPEQVVPLDDLSFNILKILPYIAVFVLAVVGVNVFIVLAVGVVLAAVIGIALGDLTFATAAQSLYSGVTDMDEIYYLTMLASGLAGFTKSRGGIEWLIEKLSKVCKSAKSSQIAIAISVALIDIAVATNTVAIILCGDMAKNISKEYKIDPRRTASILDIFSCVPQGLLPYSGQLLISATFAAAAGLSFNAVSFIPYVWYSFILAFFGILSIFVPFADGVCKKHPWNWEEETADETV